MIDKDYENFIARMGSFDMNSEDFLDLNHSESRFLKITGEELYHYGVPGMRWGNRKGSIKSAVVGAAKKYADFANNTNKQVDFNRLKKASKKASKAGGKYIDFVEKHSYDTNMGQVYVDNKKLLRSAIRNSRKVDNLVTELSMKYKNVSAIPGKNQETGKRYVDLTIDNKKERIDVD